MNTLRNGTTAVGAPGSTMRRKAEVEDIIRGIIRHDEALIAGVVKSFYDLYVSSGRDAVSFIKCATRDAGLDSQTAGNLFYRIQQEEKTANQ